MKDLDARSFILGALCGAVLLLALYFAVGKRSPRYQVSAGERGGTAWVVDTKTGESWFRAGAEVMFHAPRPER